MENKPIQTVSGKELLKKSLQGDYKPIFGNLIYEGELGILFGDSNTGKSILANDMCFFVSGGGHDWDGMESPNIPSMFIDLELSDQQWCSRYKSAIDYMPECFDRTSLINNACVMEDLFEFIKYEILTRQNCDNPPKFIVIDNVSVLGSIYGANKMRDLMFKLKTLKENLGLTILLLAHCPKRKKDKPITDNDLGGSKMLLNFCDSAFAIANSMKDDDLKYIKQVKSRAGAKLSQVMSVRIVNEPYLSMRFEGMSNEEEHLIEPLGWHGMPRSVERELVAYLNQGNLTINEISNSTKLSTFFICDYMIEHGYIKKKK